MGKPVRVKAAPGLAWKKRANGIYEGRWQARHDIVKRGGFSPKSVLLWSGRGDPQPWEWNDIADRCHRLQAEMMAWHHGLPELVPAGPGFNGMLSSLWRCYRTDLDSPYHDLRFASRENYDVVMGLICKQYGSERLEDLSGRKFKHWHRDWSNGGHLAIAHSKMQMLRLLFNFGVTILEDRECERLVGALAAMRFPMAKPRSSVLVAEQADAICAEAHKAGLRSMALAQAFQFECMLRQKDVIGEWVPQTEPVPSEITRLDGWKWIRGLRWSEIDANFVLRHVTSKRQKEIEIDLKQAPMVMRELHLAHGIDVARPDRSVLPIGGAVIIYERTKLPWSTHEFRRLWRKVATAADVPKYVRNMDSRAGAITEATDAGAALEEVRHAATHSQSSTTARYSRGPADKIKQVQAKRLAFRNKSGT